MRVVIALLPVLVTIGSIVLLNVHIARACAYGLLAAIVIAAVQFGFPAGSIAGHLIHGSLSSWDILLLVTGGSLMGALLTANGTTRALSNAFAANGAPVGSSATPRESQARAALIAGTCLGVTPALFASIGPGAYFVALPLLASFGIPADRAIPAFLLSQSWGLAAFTFGLPVTAMSTATQIAPDVIMRWAIVPIVVLIAVVAFLSRVLMPEMRPLGAGSLALIAGAAACGVVIGGMIGPAFPTLFGGLLAALAALALQRNGSMLKQLSAVPVAGLLPIAVVAFHAVMIRVPQVRALVASLSWSVPTQVGDIEFAIGTSSGAVLLVVSIAGLMRLERQEMKKCLDVVRRSRTAMVVAPIAMSMASIMNATGMIAEIARASASLGRVPFAFCLPAIGMLGHYVTGSTISGNLVIGNYVAETARTLGLNPSLAAAVALVGGAAGVVIIPAKIAIASAALNHPGGQKVIVQRGLLAAAVSSLAVTLVMLTLGGL